ncbi:MAG: Obg family GTPase CgtA, partial [Chloroflexi bacterium]|nr:Obg family GTPase CgtA [Chloroflexota bacterium]
VILDLELKLLADVGILARPNAGKSTLISRCSAAKPKVADYPFTTVEPILGVVSIHNKDFVMMEIPGLLEGAHLGVGLGYRFLKHAERAKMYLYLVDGLAEDPVGDLQMVNHELMQFSPELAAKPQIIAVNKLDVTEVKENRGELERALIELKGGPQVQGLRDAPIFFISAVSGEGVTELLGKIVEVLGNVPVAEPDDLLEAPVPVSRRRPRTASSVSVEKGVYVVQSEELERLVTMSDTRDRRVLLQLWREMGRLGVAVQLEEAGVEAGDTIRIGDAEVEWF